MLDGGTVRLELKKHHASREEALEQVSPYVRSWELDACLRGRPGDFQLRFDHEEIIDRDPPPPTPGPVNLALTATAGAPTAGMSLSVVQPAYPPPPGMTLKADDPDALLGEGGGGRGAARKAKGS